MKALVTGASGFLGSHIVDRLQERGVEVVALARPSSDVSYLQAREVPLVRGDVTAPDSLRAAVQGVDVVYHAAAMVSDWAPWRAFQEATIEGTRNALEAAAGAGVRRFLLVSTDSVYPTRLKLRGATISEDQPAEKRPPSWDYYQRSKLAAEGIAWEYHRSGRLEVSAVRPALILGERDRAIMPEIVGYLRSGRAVYVGKEACRWHCVYGGDAAEACVLAATRPEAAGRAYNVGAELLTQREMFTYVAGLIGTAPPQRTLPFWLVYWYGAVSEALGRLLRRAKRPTITRFGAATLAQDYVLDTSRLQNELGWEPKVAVREAIRRSVEWLQGRQGRAGGG